MWSRAATDVAKRVLAEDGSVVTVGGRPELDREEGVRVWEYPGWSEPAKGWRSKKGAAAFRRLAEIPSEPDVWLFWKPHLFILAKYRADVRDEARIVHGNGEIQEPHYEKGTFTRPEPLASLLDVVLAQDGSRTGHQVDLRGHGSPLGRE